MKCYMLEQVRDSDELLLLGFSANLTDWFSRLEVLEPGTDVVTTLPLALNRLLAQWITPTVGSCNDALEWALLGLHDRLWEKNVVGQHDRDQLTVDEALRLLREHQSARDTKDVAYQQWLEAIADVSQATKTRNVDNTLLPILEIETELTQVSGKDFVRELADEVMKQCNHDAVVFCGGLDMLGVGAFGDHEGFAVFRRTREDDKSRHKRFFARRKLSRSTRGI